MCENLKERVFEYKEGHEEEGLSNLRMALKEGIKTLPKRKPIQRLQETPMCSEIERLYQEKNEIHRRIKQHNTKAATKSNLRTERNLMNKRLKHLTRGRAIWRIEKKIEERSDEGLAFEVIKMLKRREKIPKTIKLHSGEETDDQQAMEKDLRRHFNEEDDEEMPEPLSKPITAAEVEAQMKYRPRF